MAHHAPQDIFTIGHSAHSYEHFVQLLRSANVTAVADVRSSPNSRFPHFNMDQIKEELRLDGIAYVYLGKELGGRPKDRNLFCDGIADYEKMALTDEFEKGLRRVLEGAQRYQIALMCSESDPLDCHRCLLVGRALSERGANVRHILSNGTVISHQEIEQKILELAGRDSDDLLMSEAQRLATAYRERSRSVAFTEKSDQKRPIPADND